MVSLLFVPGVAGSYVAAGAGSVASIARLVTLRKKRFGDESCLEAKINL